MRKRAGKSGGGFGFGRALAAALAAGTGIFAGIHFTEEARAFVTVAPTKHVVDLIPLEEVGKPDPAQRGHLPPEPGRRARDGRPGGVPGEGEAAAEKSRRIEFNPGEEIDRGPSEGNRIALTFDAGSGAASVPAILAALREAGIRCTFFLTGEWAENHARAVRAIVAGRHELGNHTFSHPDLTRLSDDEIVSELRRADEAVRAAGGAGTQPYFRPPLGARNRRVIELAADEGYRTVYWTLDSLDSVVAGITPEAIRRRVAERARPGSIVLLHCGSQATADALPGILADLRAAGYHPGTLSELLR